MGDIESRKVRLVEVTTPEPSPFARSLLFGYVAQFLYEGDSPLAERRAAALSLDSRLLAELLGQAELRELLDAEVLAELERELQWLTEDRRVKDVEGVADVLRLLGPLTDAELAGRGAEPRWARELAAARRAIRVRIAGQDHWAAVEDAGRLRDALGTALPVGVPEAFTEPVKDPLGDLLARYARTHGPFTSVTAAARFGLGVAVTEGALHRLAAGGRVVQGEFHPAGIGQEWCDAAVLRRLRRRSLAALRHEVEPVPPAALAQFLPQWQHIGKGHGLRGLDGLVRAVEQLQGASVPASALEKLVLPSRVTDYTPAMLDELTAAGEVVWAGAGALPGKDGWVSLYLADAAPLLLPTPHPLEPTALHESVLSALSGGYGLFFRQIADQVRATTHPDVTDPQLADALWDLAWSGRLTNDTLAPMRSPVSYTHLMCIRDSCFPRPNRTRPCAPTAGLAPSSTGTAWSRGERSPLRAWRAASRRCTACCPPSRTAVRPGAAMWSRAWAPPSSRWTGPSIASVRCPTPVNAARTFPPRVSRTPSAAGAQTPRSSSTAATPPRTASTRWRARSPTRAWTTTSSGRRRAPATAAGRRRSVPAPGATTSRPATWLRPTAPSPPPATAGPGAGAPPPPTARRRTAASATGVRALRPPTPGPWSWPRPTLPTPTERPCPGPSRRRGPDTSRAARRVLSSCWWRAS